MFEIESGLIIWTSISFAILVFLMYRLALPPILKVLKERENTISQALSQAEAGKRESETLLSAYRQRLAEASETGEKMLLEARREGEKLKQVIIEAGRKNADLLIVRAQEDLKKEKNRIVSEIKAEEADLVALAAGKLLKRKIDKAENIKLIEESLK